MNHCKLFDDKSRRLIIVIFAVYTVFAIATFAITSFDSYRMWASMAAPGYLLALAITAIAGLSKQQQVARAGIVVATFIAFLGSVALPLAVAMQQGMEQPELAVIENGAALMLERGTPFLQPAELNETRLLYNYNPYLPGMALLGVVATALATDLRLIFGLAFVACVIASLLISRQAKSVKDLGRRSVATGVGLLLVSPFIALPLALGGDDLPVLGLICLGLALGASRMRMAALAGGAAMGAAFALKAIALPAVPVGLALVARLHGARAAAIYLASSVAVFALTVMPSFLRSPDALIENTIKFPLGMAEVATTASDPLPGHLIAANMQHGEAIAMGLLLLAGVAVAASLFLRPPENLNKAVKRLAIGTALAFVLTPAVRWGYFIYPLGLLLWAMVVGRITQRRIVESRPEPVEEPLAA